MAKVVWKTQYSNTGEKFYTEPGSGIVKKFSSKLDEKGNIIVYEDGETDLYGYIQSFKDSTDINNIMKRYAAGDVSVLETKRGEYADLTKLPENFFEMVNSFNKGKELFYELKPEVREKFGNNVEKFLGTIGTDEWLDNLGFVEKAEHSPEINESEVNEA